MSDARGLWRLVPVPGTQTFKVLGPSSHSVKCFHKLPEGLYAIITWYPVVNPQMHSPVKVTLAFAFRAVKPMYSSNFTKAWKPKPVKREMTVWFQRAMNSPGVPIFIKLRANHRWSKRPVVNPLYRSLNTHWKIDEFSFLMRNKVTE